jgi:hypothetical protein
MRLFDQARRTPPLRRRPALRRDASRFRACTFFTDEAISIT